jgi:pilus assembly protein Flp/PilA
MSAGWRCSYEASPFVGAGQPQSGIYQQTKGVNTHMLMTYFRSLLAQIVRDEKGQTAVEYGLVLALVALVIVGALALGLNGVMTTILGKITTALTAVAP